MDNDEVTSTSSPSRSRQSSSSQDTHQISVTVDNVEAPGPSASAASEPSSDKSTNPGASATDNATVTAASLASATGGAGSGSGGSSTASTPTLSGRKSKIDIVLKPVGDAPILKQKRWAVDPDKEFGTIIQFIKNYLKLDADHSLFVFVNQAFAPSPDQLIRNLYDCFGSDGKLILHYSKTVAWG